MSALCEAYEHWLPLYAEGELRDLELSASIQRHLEWCERCRDEVEDYQDFSRRLVGGQVAQPSAAGPWDPSPRSPAADSPRVARIMGAIAGSARRQQARRLWRRRLGALAAMLLVASGVGIAAGRFFSRPPGPRSSIAFEFERAAENEAAAVDPRLLEQVVWRFAGADPAAQTRPGSPMQLVGFLSRPSLLDEAAGRAQETPGTALSPSRLRWILEARLRERDVPAGGGGWPYLVPAAASASTSAAEHALPLCRVRVQPCDPRLASALGLPATEPAGPGGRLYCLVVVRGPEILWGSCQELPRPAVFEIFGPLPPSTPAAGLPLLREPAPARWLPAPGEQF